MELERNDGLKESAFTIKFVAYKTPSSGKRAIPDKLFFIFKFFTFKNI
jgi:hypothetical protein